jgi:predicted nucleic acid-binding protein
VNYVVDTSALIRYVRGDRAATERIQSLGESGETLGCCAVVVAEFYSGIALGQHENWDELLDGLVFWPTTRATAIRAGNYRREARRENRTLSTPDTLIAAVAFEQHATVLTANPRDFPMDDIRVESVR